jgi:hypothetical protein
MLRQHRVHLRLSDAEAARLDEIRGVVPRVAFLRELIRTAGPLTGGPSHGEALALLREAALNGNVNARVSYERALRGITPPEDSADALEQLLRDSPP